MTTTIVFGEETDGEVYSESVDYTTARAGANEFVILGSFLAPGQGPVDGTFVLSEAFIAFDIAAASIPEGDSITDVDLALHQESGRVTAAFDVEAREYDWGPTLTTGDWVPGADLGSLDLLATLAATEDIETLLTFTPSGSALIDHVEAHRTGVSRILLNSSRHRIGNAPTGDEVVWFYSARISGTTNDPRLVIEHGEPPEEYDTDGTLALTLGISGTARKVSRSTGALHLDLTASDDATKTGQTDGHVTLTAAVEAAAIAAKLTEAIIDTELSIDGTTVKTGAVSGTVALEAAIEAEALAHKLTDATVDLDLSINGSTSKAAEVTAALDLAFALAADATKAAQVAAQLGIDLDIAGTAIRHDAGHATGTIALALAITATAVKHVTTTGALDLALDVDGTARRVEDDHPHARLDLLLAIGGTARKHAATVATLDLFLAIVGRIGTDWVLDPCRTLTVESEHRVLVVSAEPRVFHVAHENRTLLVTC